MPEYISREAAKDEMCERCSNVLMCTRSDNDCPIKRGLNSISAADVVEVVRCAECKFSGKSVVRNRTEVSYCHRHLHIVDLDYYCADGKRKDGGQDK